MATSPKSAGRTYRPVGSVSVSDKTPKSGHEGRSTTRTWVKRGFLLIATVFGLGLVLFAFAYATTDIPDPNEGF